MTIEEARDIARNLSQIPEPYDADYDELRGFDATDPTAKLRIREAMTLLMEAGLDEEQAHAAWFLGHRGEPAHIARMAQLYAERGWSSRYAAEESVPLFARPGLAAALGLSRHDQWKSINAADRLVLARVFLSDPERHLGIARAAIQPPEGAEAWRALAALIETADDPKVIEYAYQAAVATPREDDFWALIRTRPEPAIRAAAEWMSRPEGQRLLKARGLSVDAPGTPDRAPAVRKQIGYELPASMLLSAAQRLFARLHVPFRASAEPSGHEVVNPYEQRTWWEDGGARVMLRARDEDVSTNSMAPSLRTHYYSELTGLPGKVAVLLSGRERITEYEVREGNENERTAAAAMSGALWDLLRAESAFPEHPAVPPEWTSRARTVSAVEPYPYVCVCPYRLLVGDEDGVRIGIIRAGEIGNPAQPPWLIALGPLPSTVHSSSFRLPSSPGRLPPLTEVLPVLDPVSPSPRLETSELRKLTELTRGPFGGFESVFEMEEVSMWRAGEWTLRQVLSFGIGEPPESADVTWAIQHEHGGDLALFLRSVPSGDARETYGDVVGDERTGAAAAERVRAMLAATAP